MYAEGTRALYISESHDSEKVYILTARHVVFPRNAGSNELYYCTRTNRHHRKDILPGPWAFQKVLKSTMGKIGGDLIMVGPPQPAARPFEDDRWPTGTRRRHRSKPITNSTTKPQILERREPARHRPHRLLPSHLRRYRHRTLHGGLGLSLSSTTTRSTGKNFKGNVIELGTNIPAHEFHFKMSPAAPTFKYPPDRLFPLQGVIEEDELRRPQMRDAAGEPCLTVAKNGCTTGVTIGCATGIKSFVREYFPDGTHETSVEWAILPHDDKAGAFSAPGDSGAIIFDGRGRIGGLLTGGAGKTNSIDITYGTAVLLAHAAY
ncbi:hypothetical protein F5146DRAFT_1193358 [Armillaria mellea]|nr:hypothetical protein F5146DRAFT_1193358 [Armillaria mellea]